MKARCIDYAETRATVVLEPSWWARLWGARDVAVDLMRDPSSKLDSEKAWRSPATGRGVSSMHHDRAILEALEQREIGSPRRALTGGTVAP